MIDLGRAEQERQEYHVIHNEWPHYHTFVIQLQALTVLSRRKLLALHAHTRWSDLEQNQFAALRSRHCQGTREARIQSRFPRQSTHLPVPQRPVMPDK